MRSRCILPIAAMVAAFSTDGIAQVYQANYAAAPPVIDGVVSPGEWNRAEQAVVIASDSFGGAMRLMWDNESLYGLLTTNYTGFRASSLQAEAFQWDDDTNWNLYIDPNRDGEDLDAVTAGNIDGYQIAAHIHEGTHSCSPCSDLTQDGTGGSINRGYPGTNIGTFTEGHIDSLWGNQAEWAGLRQSEIAMTNNSTGGVSEIRIPWSDLDASGANTGDTGLNLNNMAPIDGDVWSWNFAYVYPDEQTVNWTPIWVGGTPFARDPHGQVVFAVPEPSALAIATISVFCVFMRRSRTS